MKKAFTMIELVFVIVVAAILAVAIMPRMSDDSLRQAADQILMHIRYTQHLAMVNDAYDPDLASKIIPNTETAAWSKNWEDHKWRFEFTNITTEPTFAGIDAREKKWRYNIHRNRTESLNLNSLNQVAIDPQNPTKKLTAGYSYGSYPTNKAERVKFFKKFNLNLNIQGKYGIDDVLGEKDSGCPSPKIENGFAIIFNEMGAPQTATKGGDKADNTYTDITSQCRIALTRNEKSEGICILIEPETGYSCIADYNTNTKKCEKTCNNQ